MLFKCAQRGLIIAVVHGASQQMAVRLTLSQQSALVQPQTPAGLEKADFISIHRSFDIAEALVRNNGLSSQTI